MNFRLEALWVEKYRPKRLVDVIDQEHVKTRLLEFIKLKDLPHLLFYGPPGTGKTTMALALAYELYGDAWRENVLELNASDERGISVIRERVKEFARTAPMGKANFKLIILDEADNMTSDAQQALRRTMEMYAQNARFILIANYVSRIIDPIQSRTAMFRFSPLPKELVFQRLEYIAKCEGISITREGLEAIWEISQGDMRKAINILQAASAIESKVSVETIYRALGKVSPSVLKNILYEAIYGNFSKALRQIYELIHEQCVDPIDIIKAIHREVMSYASQLKIPENMKPKLIFTVSNHHYRILRGSDAELQISALLAKLRKIVNMLGGT